jgi:hypothetical protein
MKRKTIRSYSTRKHLVTVLAIALASTTLVAPALAQLRTDVNVTGGVAVPLSVPVDAGARQSLEAGARPTSPPADATDFKEARHAAQVATQARTEVDAAAQAKAKVDAVGNAAVGALDAVDAQGDARLRLDADADGRISSGEAEADPGFEAGFKAMDRDADGFVTKAELEAHAEANKAP